MLRDCLLIVVLVSFCELTQAQYTAIPDENFELALISLGLDAGEADGQVLTANLAEVDDLNVNDAGISDLTGLAGFVALERLHCAGNELNALDLTVLPLLYYLHCNDNSLTTLDLSMNPLMRTILCSGNQIQQLQRIICLCCVNLHAITMSSQRSTFRTTLSSTVFSAGEMISLSWI